MVGARRWGSNLVDLVWMVGSFDLYRNAKILGNTIAAERGSVGVKKILDGLAWVTAASAIQNTPMPDCVLSPSPNLVYC